MLTVRLVDTEGRWLKGKPETRPVRKPLGPRYSEAGGMLPVFGKNTDIFPCMEVEPHTFELLLSQRQIDRKQKHGGQWGWAPGECRGAGELTAWLRGKERPKAWRRTEGRRNQNGVSEASRTRQGQGAGGCAT